ncbi:MAG TPA: FIST N-terminal domain-containing protein [Syntrophales bacterium]|jgi:hypothetical protein|nr:FIST N-terminal domain-containing protein [Syntrophales bacterium]HQJ29949.1 FIST N-terminal domain-containing protein [Syntrophales bacterium]HRR46380.1 FIST N-terminal domain-containing protein [Syntrophales bacterium]HRU87796.1 FIST N-terminal domain-containing protein [Syntrophales bacterium]
MIIKQHQWKRTTGWHPALTAGGRPEAQLVLVFGAAGVIEDARLLGEIRASYPEAVLCGASTAGEICCAEVCDDTLTVTAIHWEHTRVRVAGECIGHAADSLAVGRRLAEHLDEKDLRHVFVLSDGLHVNGSDLARGLMCGLSSQVSITGGLAGDGARFRKTSVLWQDGWLSDCVTAVGFYGDRLQVGYGSYGGWDPFGPERLVTRSRGNVLYEMDGKSALELYKTYLGKHARELPASGLLFPLSLRAGDRTGPLVRTLLAIDEQDQSMTFAGDIPEGSYARLMKANYDRLIDGAVTAARTGRDILGPGRPELVILISCVGRKLILKQRVEEEVEGVQEVLGRDAIYTGFYSYGEIAPTAAAGRCELHNQTMTITVFAEKETHA